MHTATIPTFIRTTSGVVQIFAGERVPDDVLPSEIDRLAAVGVLAEQEQPRTTTPEPKPEGRRPAPKPRSKGRGGRGQAATHLIIDEAQQLAEPAPVSTDATTGEGSAVGDDPQAADSQAEQTVQDDAVDSLDGDAALREQQP